MKWDEKRAITERRKEVDRQEKSNFLRWGLIGVKIF
jgi:hypothetical protein